MKFYLLLLSLALVSAVTINYDQLTGDFLTGTCLASKPWSNVNDVYNFRSPIAIQNSQCLPYGKFVLSLPDPASQVPSVDPQTGALKIAYSGATLTKDQFEWTSDAILIRYKSEHRLYIGNPENPASDDAQADLEVQIRMTSSSGSLAFLSFLIKSYDEATVSKQNKVASDMLDVARYKSSQSMPSITVDTSGSVSLALSGIARQINARVNSEYYLNIFTYNGTTTYPPCTPAAWFVYGNYLYVGNSNVDNIKTLMTTTIPASTWTSNSITLKGGMYNFRAVTGTGGGGDVQTAVRLCFTGYFDIYLNWNYGLWFGVVIIVFFFIITLSTGESPITDPDYKEECKTIHPWVSLWVVGNELHTRKTRSSLILAIITIHALFDSVWYRISNNPEQPANIIVYAAYSMVISQVFVQFYGVILRQYYIAKRQFLQTKDEKWNQRAQNRLFAFYSALFALIAICWPFCVWNMNELNPHRSQKSSNYWVASFFVGLGLEWLFIDIIWVLLAKKINFIKNLMRKRGFFYDDLCHATYMDFIKMD